jgi:hypothetical protein
VALGWYSHWHGSDVLLARNPLGCIGTLADGIRTVAASPSHRAAVPEENYFSRFSSGFNCDPDSDRCDRSACLGLDLGEHAINDVDY